MTGFQFNLKAITDCDSIRLSRWLTKVSSFFNPWNTAKNLELHTRFLYFRLFWLIRESFQMLSVYLTWTRDQFLCEMALYLNGRYDS